MLVLIRKYRNKNMKYAIIGLASISLASLACNKADELKQPNIILIMSDDMGFSDLGCYGSEIQTPNLDELAANGLRFTQFYNSARCCPTRASLLTGVYPHQAGIGLMTNDHKLPGYRGDLGKNVRTIAEVLKTKGYGTYMTGKWHITKYTNPDDPKDNWPLQRGFDKYYGTIKGAGSFYDPGTLCKNNTYITPVNDPDYKPETYYYTDAISDYSVEYIKDHKAEKGDTPFFMYVAYTAAHWPLHALPEDIARYKGVYDKGYDHIRKKRVEKLKQLGFINKDWELSPTVENWENVRDKAWETRNMEAYAAMIDRMDQGIGKIISELKKNGEFDNTIIMFLQDNGGCAEGYGRGSAKAPYPSDLKPMGINELQTKTLPPMQTRDGRPVRAGRDNMAGPDDSYCGYGRGWANVSNTPFREYKHYVHEGGISTPFIVSWPQGIDKNLYGNLIHTPAHIIDIMATCVDITESDYPTTKDDQIITPMEGNSLYSIFKGGQIQNNRPLFFEHHLNSAMRQGKWKLVRKGNTRTKEVFDWELYNMENDRTEMNNVIKENPELAHDMIEAYKHWEKRVYVTPGPFEIE